MYATPAAMDFKIGLTSHSMAGLRLFMHECVEMQCRKTVLPGCNVLDLSLTKRAGLGDLAHTFLFRCNAQVTLLAHDVR